MSNVSFRIEYDSVELCKQEMTVTSVAAATMKFLFGTCDCAIDSDAGTSDFLQGILHVCGHVYVRSHVSPGVNLNR